MVQLQAWQVRRVLNWANLSTPLGLLVARVGGAREQVGSGGLLIRAGYRLGFPVARVFTVGDVVVTREDAVWLLSRPRLLRHEERHSWQYAALLGLPMLPLYGLSVAVSWVLAADISSYNPFERLAGLADGGYPPPRHRWTGHEVSDPGPA